MGWGVEVVRNYPRQTFFLNICVSANIFSIVIFLQTTFSIFFSVLFICAKYYHFLIKLFFEEPNQ